ncbi:hypothetical protein HELRODRAFT_180891 [Helobdella robusta]|uniref:Uncharacterized protein n=1 Tax=Helobdella robusta TaxID=6412 RepID=T1FGD4_HELRO|nr:hypothetical protein HELRODRAFT_180891 [Helobdella robusta]ESN93572.1 hypothetical protein HELRODRAFT_180891 [Helobdella robusta]
MKKPNNQSNSFNNTGKLNVNSKIRNISKIAKYISTTTTAASSSPRKTTTSTKIDNKVGNKEGFSEHLGKVESSRRNVVEVRNIVERKRVKIVRKPDDNFNGVKHRGRDNVERVSNEENIKMRSRVGQVETRSPYIGQVKRLCPCVLDLYGEVYDVDDDVL